MRIAACCLFRHAGMPVCYASAMRLQLLCAVFETVWQTGVCCAAWRW
jgi:hypothetical protein